MQEFLMSLSLHLDKDIKKAIQKCETMHSLMADTVIPSVKKETVLNILLLLYPLHK